MTAPVAVTATVNAASAKNLDQLLAQLEPKLGRKVLRSALRQAGNVVRDAARQRAPRQSGLLARKIATRVGYSRRLKAWAAQVGVFSARRSKSGKKTVAMPYYARWVERGHRIVPRRGKLGRGIAVRRRVAQASGGTVAPRPFLVPALEVKQGEVQRVLMDALRRGIEDAMRGTL